MSKILKLCIRSLIIIIGVMILIVVTYISYISIQYYRIEDNMDLTNEIYNTMNTEVKLNEEYKISTYNIGFGAYNHDFSFFMDSGVMKDGTKVSGKNSKAISKDVVLSNTNGAIKIVNEIKPDFMLFQEVDVKAHRSHKINQLDMISEAFPNYNSIFASNFHSAYLAYPFNDPHGKTEAGIATYSKYYINSSIRYQLPVDESFPTKFFDLDRCFTLSRIKVENNKELVLINVHMSAYDEGGLIRQKQLSKLNEVLKAEKEKNSYVIVGGDFNHDIANSISLFKTEQEIPEWVYTFNDSNLEPGYKIISSTNAPTCRSTDIPYQEGINYSVVIDGFIVSDNVEKIAINNVDNLNDEKVSFLYSDHNAVVMTFILK